jgi:hypothetical protein
MVAHSVADRNARTKDEFLKTVGFIYIVNKNCGPHVGAVYDFQLPTIFLTWKETTGRGPQLLPIEHLGLSEICDSF